MDSNLNHPSVAPLLPLENSYDVHKWNRFITPENDKSLYSLTAKLYVTAELDIVVGRSFMDAINIIIDRDAIRGQDYVIFSLLKEDGWYIHARVDRNFISQEDIVNE